MGRAREPGRCSRNREADRRQTTGTTRPHRRRAPSTPARRRCVLLEVADGTFQHGEHQALLWSERGPDTVEPPGGAPDARDRKSTRLNSSHRCISYAVFCLKKKTFDHKRCLITGSQLNSCSPCFESFGLLKETRIEAESGNRLNRLVTQDIGCDLTIQYRIR